MASCVPQRRVPGCTRYSKTDMDTPRTHLQGCLTRTAAASTAPQSPPGCHCGGGICGIDTTSYSARAMPRSRACSRLLRNSSLLGPEGAPAGPSSPSPCPRPCPWRGSPSRRLGCVWAVSLSSPLRSWRTSRPSAAHQSCCRRRGSDTMTWRPSQGTRTRTYTVSQDPAWPDTMTWGPSQGAPTRTYTVILIQPDPTRMQHTAPIGA